MADFRLRVFEAAARHLSFTRAAEELCVTQPAVTKHVHELERTHEQRLFERRGNRLALTAAGQVLAAHAEHALALEQRLNEQLLTLRHEAGGHLRLGASSTLTQYVLPGLLPGFQARYPHVALTLLNGNSEQIAEALLRGQVDLGFVEGRTRSLDLHYELLVEDELVVVRGVVPSRPPAALSLPEVLAHPLVLRERGSGTRQVLEYALRQQQVRLSELRVAFSFDNTEAIKAYLEAAPACLGIVSRRALALELQTGRLEIVPVPALRLARQFETVWVQGQPLQHPAQRFLAFAHAHFYPSA